MVPACARWVAIAALVGGVGVATPAFADPIYLDHEHGYGGHGYRGTDWGHGHGSYRGGYGDWHQAPVYAPVYGHVHCRTVVVHTSHGHHRRQVCS